MPTDEVKAVLTVRVVPERVTKVGAVPPVEVTST
jgi:hypothetical protein